MDWIMNNAELFARGNLINQIVKINSLHVEGIKKRDITVMLPLSPPLDLTSKMQNATVASFISQLRKYAAHSQKSCYLQMLWPT